MDYERINEAIAEYNNLSPYEIQGQVKPIIQSYPIKVLSGQTGISENTLYQYCKRLFAEAGKKPGFTAYIAIMSSGMYGGKKQGRGRPVGSKNKAGRKKASRRGRPRTGMSERAKENYKRYQHEYYMRVTKKKREEAKQDGH